MCHTFSQFQIIDFKIQEKGTKTLMCIITRLQLLKKYIYTYTDSFMTLKSQKHSFVFRNYSRDSQNLFRKKVYLYISRKNFCDFFKKQKILININEIKGFSTVELIVS